MSALLHHKLEQAIVAWINANKGEALAGWRVIEAHTNEQDVPLPWIVVACMKSAVHPDFAGCGRKVPHVAPVKFLFRKCAADGEHKDMVAIALQELDDILTQPSTDGGEDYTKLIADLNPPASGPDARTTKPLYLFAVHPDGDDGDLEEHDYTDTIALEIVAQNGDPDRGEVDRWVTEAGDTVVTETGDTIQV